MYHGISTVRWVNKPTYNWRAPWLAALNVTIQKWKIDPQLTHIFVRHSNSRRWLKRPSFFDWWNVWQNSTLHGPRGNCMILWFAMYLFAFWYVEIQVVFDCPKPVLNFIGWIGNRFGWLTDTTCKYSLKDCSSILVSNHVVTSKHGITPGQGAYRPRQVSTSLQSDVISRGFK